MVAYFGLAHQYFVLRFGGRSKIYFALFLFLALARAAGGRHDSDDGVDARPSDAEKVSEVIFSLSPVAGIGVIAVLDRADAYSTAIRARRSLRPCSLPLCSTVS